MFCSKCGRPLADSALFCTFCGAPVSNGNIPVTPSAPVYESVSAPTYSAPAASAPAEPTSACAEPVPNEPLEASPTNEAAAEEPLKQPVLEGAAISVPTAPANDLSSDGMTAVPQQETHAAAEQLSSAPAEQEIHIKNEVPEKQEKYYTFGHLALCLAAVAVMAIVAGVFAGLYFSVI